MPDPHQDLADIVEPQIAVVAANNHDWLMIGGAAIAGLALAAAIYWQWRRHAPQRALRRLHGRADVQQAADELAALLPHFKQAPDAAWLDALQRLRFGPAQDDARVVFDRLCQEAVEMLSKRR